MAPAEQVGGGGGAWQKLLAESGGFVPEHSTPSCKSFLGLLLRTRDQSFLCIFLPGCGHLGVVSLHGFQPPRKASALGCVCPVRGDSCLLRWRLHLARAAAGGPPVCWPWSTDSPCIPELFSERLLYACPVHECTRYRGSAGQNNLGSGCS